MKAVIIVLVVLFTSVMACDTPEPTTTYPNDTTSIDRDRMDTMMQNDTDTMRQDTMRMP
jgi:hypothetical protein